MYNWTTLLSKGPPTAFAMCKYLAFKGAQNNCNALYFQRAPWLHWFLVLLISICGIEAFSEELSGDRTRMLGPLRHRSPPIGGMECGRYGSDLFLFPETFISVARNHQCCVFDIFLLNVAIFFRIRFIYIRGKSISGIMQRLASLANHTACHHTTKAIGVSGVMNLAITTKNW